MKIVRLKGKNVDLCVMRTDDEAFEKYLTWMNDESFNMWIGENHRVTDETREKDYINSNHTEDFNIVLKSGELIGNCSCRRESDTRNYTLGICIGEEIGRNKGIGTEVIQMLIKFAFEERNAHRVRLTLSSGNSRAYRCYEKAGFKECGREHETHFYGGKWYDTIYMEILEQQYYFYNNNYDTLLIDENKDI